MELPNALFREEIETANIYLDNKNPRLAEIREPPEWEDVTDGKVQEDIIEVMYSGDFEMEELQNSILQNGFLPIDKMVVRPLEDEEEKYVVVEGNRRLAAIKKIQEMYEGQGISEVEEVLSDLHTLEVLVLDEGKVENPETAIALLQGIRNISGLKEWGAFQKAEAIEKLYSSGYDLNKISKALGMSKRMIRRYRKAYNAFLQMREDEDFGEEWKPELWSYFEEAVRTPAIRGWLDWNDSRKIFESDEKSTFYTWVVGDEEGRRKIKESKDVRKLRELLQYKDGKYFNKLVDNEDVDVKDIYTEMKSEQAAEEARERDWKKEIADVIDLINEIPAKYLEEMEQEEVDSLEALKTSVEEQLNRRQALVR